MPTFSDGHALVIGVGSYQQERMNAPITLADASGVANALRDATVGAYPPAQVTLLHDADARGVADALRALAQRTSKTSTVLIFFCGHGALGSDGVYRFGTSDAMFTNGIINANTGMSAPDLLELLRAIPAQKLLLLVNACFSGHISPTLGGDKEVVGAPVAATLGPDLLTTGEGRALITASRPTQYSHYLTKDTYTLFGKALIDGLRGAAARADQVGLYDLYQYIYNEVKKQAAAIGAVQEPVLTITQGVGSFPVALAPAGSQNLGSPLSEPPTDAAVEQYARTSLQANGQNAQTVTANGGKIDQSKLIDFGNAQISGNVTTGDIARGDINKVTININSATAAASDKSALLDQIDKTKDAVAQVTTMAPRERKYIVQALENAHEAGSGSDNDWLLEELTKAQELLIKQGMTVPVAKQLATTVGALIQRAMSLFAPQQPGGRSHNQQIGDNAQVGVAVSGDVHGGINYHAPGSGPISGDYVAGDKFTGDKVMGDKVMGDKHVINNHAANQGAQGTFYGPVTFNNAPTAGGKAPTGEQADGSNEDERTRQVNALREQIRNNRSNLYKLKMQVAQFGGEMWTPVGVSNNIDAARKAIRDAKGKLRRLGEQVTDMPDDED